MVKSFQVSIYYECVECGIYFYAEKKQSYCDEICRERGKYKRKNNNTVGLNDGIINETNST